jgi:hypothetical protein
MAYTDSKILAITEGVVDIAATGTALCRVNQACDLFAVGALIITAPGALSTLVITRNVAPGVTEGATVVATVVVPDATAIGKIVYKEGVNPKITANQLPVKLNAGDELKFVMTGTTLTWRPWFEAYPRPEIKANNSDFLASA